MGTRAFFLSGISCDVNFMRLRSLLSGNNSRGSKIGTLLSHISISFYIQHMNGVETLTPRAKKSTSATIAKTAKVTK